MHYDYLIVGAGLFGSVFAHEMMKRGKKCLVIDKRSILPEIFIVKMWMGLMYTNMVRIFSILQIRISGSI